MLRRFWEFMSLLLLKTILLHVKASTFVSYRLLFGKIFGKFWINYTYK